MPQTQPSIYGEAANSPLLHSLVCVGGITSLSLTFLHPAMWAAVGVFLGLAILLSTTPLLFEQRIEPPGFFVVLIWIAATAFLSLAYGYTQDLYNFKQVALMLAGLLFGYFVSVVRAPAWAAWIPFGLFAAYFSALLLVGRSPADALTRNSENYVSAILLALYVSAMIMTRPPAVRILHILIAIFVLVLSIWGSGRAGILASLLLTSALFIRFVSQGRPGLVQWILAAGLICVAAAVAFVVAEFLERRGYLAEFAGRGLQDASRISIIVSYFDDIEVSELLLGKNYHHDSFMTRWGYNLHNSYLDAWANLGLSYFVFILAVLAVAARRLSANPVICIAFFAFAARAATDSQMFGGQYDYVAFAVLFILMREHTRRSFSVLPVPLRP